MDMCCFNFFFNKTLNTILSKIMFVARQGNDKEKKKDEKQEVEEKCDVGSRKARGAGGEAGAPTD